LEVNPAYLSVVGPWSNANARRRRPVVDWPRWGPDMETNSRTEPDADDSFGLESLPAEVWDMARMVVKLRAGDQTIRRWIREGRLLGPTLRRGRGAYWNPAEVEPYRRKRLRRIGAEMVEAVGVATLTASGFSLSGDQQGKANEIGA
jgi:hypothetical protein